MRLGIGDCKVPGVRPSQDFRCSFSQREALSIEEVSIYLFPGDPCNARSKEGSVQEVAGGWRWAGCKWKVSKCNMDLSSFGRMGRFCEQNYKRLHCRSFSPPFTNAAELTHMFTESRYLGKEKVLCHISFPFFVFSPPQFIVFKGGLLWSSHAWRSSAEAPFPQ